MNKNINKIEISGIRKFFNKVQKVENAISLTLGQPDFETPLDIKKAMIKAIEENKTIYTANAGLIELRDEISKYLLKEHKINYEAEEICITVGGSEALFSVFLSLINEGDRVLIPTPSYPAYESIVTLLGGEVVNYKLDANFEIDLDDIESKIIQDNIKILVLSFPCNPTGMTLSKDKRDKLVEIIKFHDIYVVTDEIYSALCYGEYYSIAQKYEIRDKVIYINGFSKMFSFTGLRVGYFCSSKELMNEFIKTHQYNVSCATSVSQWGAYEGLKSSLLYVENMKNEFCNRRDYVVDRLRKMNLEVVEPLGAFYVFPSIKRFNISSEEFCDKLLNEFKVAIVPGSAFGKGGEGYIRISYCYSLKELKEALDRLEKMVKLL